MVGSGWEWMGVGGSEWEWMGVGGTGWEWMGTQFSITLKELLKWLFKNSDLVV